ncbi:uncharacterized protein LOC143276093 isoform X2 [Babylonia areolata]|uniref:uncharacterized protein LOC143276093 isoform X2 n=1 Tax=Babylonia areolata TaxID=304850 RepID=UPI003FCFFC78
MPPQQDREVSAWWPVRSTAGSPVAGTARSSPGAMEETNVAGSAGESQEDAVDEAERPEEPSPTAQEKDSSQQNSHEDSTGGDPEDEAKEKGTSSLEINCPERGQETWEAGSAPEPPQPDTAASEDTEPARREPPAQSAGEELGKSGAAVSPSVPVEPGTRDPELSGWKSVPVRGTLRCYMHVDITLLRSHWKNVQKVVESHVRARSVVVYTAGCVAARRARSAWAFVAEHGHVEVARHCHCVGHVVDRVALEERAITAALDWIGGQTFRQVVMVTDCMSLLNKIRHGRLHGQWARSLPVSTVRSLTWVFSPASYGFNTDRTAHQLARQRCLESSG